ncbi:sensor protein KdpD [Elizabethkingia anophelis]|uniref:sensor protein KdpD n=1 Tax=Elizabethkingia anophelis TaxID=1117645 RepID=UPI0021A86AE2|nr:sensor protein KdpD [Elizabethkingia anophelis]
MSSADHFLQLIQKSKRGKFKIYIGMSAGVGKTFRMLQEAHTLLRNGIDVKAGFIETHGREETDALAIGIPTIERRSIFYKGKYLEEMDLQAIINDHPEVVLVDELAHTNVEGSKNKKRWQDVLEILENGINVISAMNIQHIESLNEDVKNITGIEVSERVPDKVLALADEVVNIDLTADELLTRLKEGKIYKKEKIETALANFFQSNHILQLRELALKEVATHVEKKVEAEIKTENFKPVKFLACISSNEKVAKTIIRKTARMASYYSSPWTVLYIQKPSESPEKIALDKQRYLINNFNLAQELGAKVVRMKESSVHQGILEYVNQHNITTVCIGKPRHKLWQRISGYSWIYTLMNRLNEKHIDIIILS